jgi:methionyl-tRNA formyltransferase
LRVVFAGTPEFAATALKAIVDAGFSVVAAYTQPDRPSGRGMKLTASAVKNAAAARGIAVLQPATLKTAEAQAELAAFKPDVMVVAAYGLILPQAVLDIPRLGCVNIHASLLPRWRGAAPIHRAILAGDAESGVCIMQMEAGLDTGPVLSARHTAITPLDTTGSLHDRLAHLGAHAVTDVLRALASGTQAPAVTQPQQGITYAHKITPAEAQIDWSNDATQVVRQINAFNPSPGAWTFWRGEKIKIWSAQVVREGETETLGNHHRATDTIENGTIVAAVGERLLVRCGSNLLAIDEIQSAGSKRMSVKAWSQGSAPQVGERLVSEQNADFTQPG